MNTEYTDFRQNTQAPFQIPSIISFVVIDNGGEEGVDPKFISECVVEDLVLVPTDCILSKCAP